MLGGPSLGVIVEAGCAVEHQLLDVAGGNLERELVWGGEPVLV
jgi:hypothetical protein